jgi:cardiolipin synthase A/B
MVHSKCAAIDDIWSMVSSYNLDHRSLLHNLEAGVLMLDRPVAHALRDQLMIDITVSREVLFDQHQSRSWKAALMESLAYQMRYWL